MDPLAFGPFERLRAETREMLASRARETGVPEGEILIWEKSASSGCYRVELDRGRRSRTLVPPDVVREMGPVTGRPRNATVVAAEASQLLFLPINDLREAMADDPEFAAALRRHVEARMAQRAD